MENRADTSAASWRTAEAYTYLYEVERRMFAWEWLRRTRDYHEAWTAAHRLDPFAREAVARLFGLAALIDPAYDGATARPIWLAQHDPHVVVARVEESGAPPADRLDVRRFGGTAAALAVDAAGVEYWRLGDAKLAVRLDLREGTLLGAPTPLAYDVAGLIRVKPTLDALQTLLHLVKSPPNGRGTGSARPRISRWILELRTADALVAGATQRTMAVNFFGPPAAMWRQHEDSYRLRIQRLVRRARACLANPLARSWFSAD